MGVSYKGLLLLICTQKMRIRFPLLPPLRIRIRGIPLAHNQKQRDATSRSATI